MKNVDIHHSTVEVAGKSYQLSGAEDPTHFAQVASVTDRRIAESARMNPLLDREGAAVAAALSFADELIKAQQTVARLKRQLKKELPDE